MNWRLEMLSKEKVTMGISLIAIILSITNTIVGETKYKVERERSIKNELSSTLTKVMDIIKENTVLARDFMKSKDQQEFYIAQSSNINQENVFLIQQAMYLASEIPKLVTPVEYNTIAIANANSGDLQMAEKYHLLAIEKSKDPYYSALAIRSYAFFIFMQRRFEEGRIQFQKSLMQIKGGDNYVRSVNGTTYQTWGSLEYSVANNSDKALDLFRQAHNEFVGIDNSMVRGNMIRILNSVIETSTNGVLNLDRLLMKKK